MGWHYVVRFKWDVDGMMGVGCYLTCASLNDVVPCACARTHNHTFVYTRFRYTPACPVQHRTLNCDRESGRVGT